MTHTSSRAYMQSNVGGKALPAPYEPQEVSQAQLVFPAGVGPLMPAPDDTPEEFWNGRSSWVDMVDCWFAVGLSRDAVVDVKDGIDANTAFRHLSCIMGSFEPKHEHKVAAVAFLSERWFHSLESDGKTYGTPRSKKTQKPRSKKTQK